MTRKQRTVSRAKAYRIAREGGPKGQEIDPFVGPEGNLYMYLTRGDVITQHRVDEMVAEAFLKPKPQGAIGVRHIDGDPQNCRATNLEWIVPE